MHQVKPRNVTSVLVEETPRGVTVTWGLGDPIPGAVEYLTYAFVYYDENGRNGKRFSVRFAEKPTAYIWDGASGTQANYTADSIAATESSIVVFYVDATLGDAEIGLLEAYSTLNGQDVQTGIPVTLLR